MKKNHKIIFGIATLFFLMITGHTYALQKVPLMNDSNGKNILAAFRFVKYIPQQNISIPTVVEFPLSQTEISQQPFLLYEIESDKTVNFSIQTIYGKQPIKISTDAQSSIDITQLHDTNSNSFFEATADGTEKTTTLHYRSTAAITSSMLKITLAPNAFEPTNVTILALSSTDGVWKTVASQVGYRGGLIVFPQEQASEWQIVFSHKQPLRMAEVEMVSATPSVASYNAIRFLAEPGKLYYLYLSPDRSVSVPYAEYTNLEGPISTINRIDTPISVTNSLYAKADIDNDSVIDEVDNCPTVANTDQKDVNGNRIGDACEDFDRDGVMNNRDNCPNNPNANQADADSDKYGDVCDPEESRLTERIWWLPWLGIAVGFGTVMAIFYSTAKGLKKETTN